MRRLLRFLNLALFANLGSFLGFGIYHFLDYRAHPLVYQMQSAPWYTPILLRGAATAITAAVLLVIRYFIKRKLDG